MHQTNELHRLSCPGEQYICLHIRRTFALRYSFTEMCIYIKDLYFTKAKHCTAGPRTLGDPGRRLHCKMHPLSVFGSAVEWEEVFSCTAGRSPSALTAAFEFAGSGAPLVCT